MNTSNTTNSSGRKSILDKKIKHNKYLFSAGICFMIYSIIEIIDSIYLILIVLNLAPNLYLYMDIIIPEIQQILIYQPVYFLPFFFSFTLMRIFSTRVFLRTVYGEFTLEF
jgi:hypothetical protein